MKYYGEESKMPIGEIPKGDGTVEHLACPGSKRHVLHYDEDGIHCSFKNCEYNHNSIESNMVEEAAKIFLAEMAGPHRESPKVYGESPIKTAKQIYDKGFVDGLKTFAHWKDGEQYVGTTGTTLKKAIANKEEIFNYRRDKYETDK